MARSFRTSPSASRVHMVTDNDCSGGYSAHGVSGQGGWNGQGHAEPLCAAGLSSNPQCCQVDVGGVLDLTCQTGESACHISQFRTSLTVVQRLVTHTTSMNSSRPAPPSVARHNAAASLWYVHVVLVLVEPTANHSFSSETSSSATTHSHREPDQPGPQNCSS